MWSRGQETPDASPALPAGTVTQLPPTLPGVPVCKPRGLDQTNLRFRRLHSCNSILTEPPAHFKHADSEQLLRPLFRLTLLAVCRRTSIAGGEGDQMLVVRVSQVLMSWVKGRRPHVLQGDRRPFSTAEGCTHLILCLSVFLLLHWFAGFLRALLNVACLHCSLILHHRL